MMKLTQNVRLQLRLAFAEEARASSERTSGLQHEVAALLDSAEEKALFAAAADARQQGRSAGMAEIVDSVGGVTALMDRIATSSREQASGVRQVYQAIAELDHATQQNAAPAEESAVAGETMREHALGLARQVAVFRIGAEAPAPLALTSRPVLISEPIGLHISRI
jgi:methyl-accepting chemotaxis protein